MLVIWTWKKEQTIKFPLKLTIKEAKKEIPRLHFFFGYIILEFYSRLLGAWDYHIKKENPYIWDIAESTKEVGESE